MNWRWLVEICFFFFLDSMNAWKSKKFTRICSVSGISVSYFFFWAWDWTFWITTWVYCVWYLFFCVLRFKSVDIVHTYCLFNYSRELLLFYRREKYFSFLFEIDLLIVKCSNLWFRKENTNAKCLHLIFLH